MLQFQIKKGTTGVILPISVFDSSSAVGAKLAGLTYNTSGLTAYYNRLGTAGAAVVLPLVSTTKGTWTSGGFMAIDGTNMPGDYELHVPDAVLAAGADSVLLQLKGAASMVPVNILIQLIAFDMQSPSVTLATAQPNYAPAKTGDAMTLTAAYNAAKVAAAQSDITAIKGVTDKLVLGSDNKVLMSTDAQDLSTTFKVNTKVVEDKTGYALIASYDPAKIAASQTSINSLAQLFTGITSMAAWLRIITRKDVGDVTAKAEMNAGGGTYDETTSSQQATAVTLAAVQSRVNNANGTQLIQTSLPAAIVRAAAGDRWQEIEVLVTDTTGAPFDPADVTPITGPRAYNGVGIAIADSGDNNIVLYKDNLGTPLDVVTLCHHADQNNTPGSIRPQYLKRVSAGVYNFWINATAANNALPLGSLHAKIAFFNIKQEDAVYGVAHINDTNPTAHIKLLLSATVEDSLGLEAINDTLVSIKGQTDQLSFAGGALRSHITASEDVDFTTTQLATLEALTPVTVGAVTAPVTVGTNLDKDGYSATATNMVAAPNNAGIATLLAEYVAPNNADLTTVKTDLAALVAAYVAPNNADTTEIKTALENFIGNYVPVDNASIATTLTKINDPTAGLVKIATNVSSVLTRLSATRAALIDNLQLLTESPLSAAAFAASGADNAAVAAHLTAIDDILSTISENLGLSGSCKVSIDLTLVDGTPLADASVWLTDTEGNLVVTRVTTNSAGRVCAGSVAYLQMRPGSYELKAVKAGVNFGAVYTFTVLPNVDTAVTFSAETFPLPVNADPRYQIVYGNLLFGDGLPAGNKSISFVPTPNQTLPAILVEIEARKYTTRENDGYFEAKLFVGVEYKLIMSKWGEDFVFTVTDEPIKTIDAYANPVII